MDIIINISNFINENNNFKYMMNKSNMIYTFYNLYYIKSKLIKLHFYNNLKDNQKDKRFSLIRKIINNSQRCMMYNMQHLYKIYNYQGILYKHFQNYRHNILQDIFVDMNFHIKNIIIHMMYKNHQVNYNLDMDMHIINI